MIDSIVITKTLAADSRSMEEPPSIEELSKATREHQGHVGQGLLYFIDELCDRIDLHDHTKQAHMEEFREALLGGDIKNSSWYKFHISEERHHLLTGPHEDVNLIDVLEHITDCVMAGLARSGDIYDVELPSELLTKAVANTVEQLKTIVVVEEKEFTEIPLDPYDGYFVIGRDHSRIAGGPHQDPFYDNDREC